MFSIEQPNVLYFFLKAKQRCLHANTEFPELSVCVCVCLFMSICVYYSVPTEAFWSM